MALMQQKETSQLGRRPYRPPSVVSLPVKAPALLMVTCPPGQTLCPGDFCVIGPECPPP